MLRHKIRLRLYEISSVRDLTLDILSAHGYNVLLAQDGLEALHVYKAFGHNIDLVLLDMIMPRMDGKETYKKLKEIDPDITVLFCSGYSQNHRLCEELKKSNLPYVNKPFRIDDLLRKMRQVLDHEAGSVNIR
ncbi:MAG: hypothetical protein C4B57_11925 [Deltaproteobacteria bacterium]|nr:MAG: hypothetical protein C4B57_11925 [Deltaproteobacteria bacterium]